MFGYVDGPWHMMWGGWGFWWIFPLFMLLMIGACFYMIVRMMGGRDHGRSSGSGALGILSERFAKGEISREEFEEKRTILAGKP